MPGTSARLEEMKYVNLLGLRFEDGDLMVRVYHHPENGRSKLFCRTTRPAHSVKDSCEYLASLKISRSGALLKFERDERLWACLRFLTYESTFMRPLSLGLSLWYLQALS